MRFAGALLLASVLSAGCQRDAGLPATGRVARSDGPNTSEAAAVSYSLSRADTAAIFEAVLREFLASDGGDSDDIYFAWGWGEDSRLEDPPADFLDRLGDLEVRVRPVSELGVIGSADLRINRKGPPSKLADPVTGALPRIIYPSRIDLLGECIACVRLRPWRHDEIPGWQLALVDGRWIVKQRLLPLIVCNL